VGDITHPVGRWWSAAYLCATEAARVAGYSENGINVTGPKTLKDPKVRLAVDILLEERTTALSPPKVDAAWLLAEAVDSYLIAKGKITSPLPKGFSRSLLAIPPFGERSWQCSTGSMQVPKFRSRIG